MGHFLDRSDSIISSVLSLIGAVHQLANLNSDQGKLYALEALRKTNRLIRGIYFL